MSGILENPFLEVLPEDPSGDSILQGPALMVTPLPEVGDICQWPDQANLIAKPSARIDPIQRCTKKHNYLETRE